MKIWEHPLYIEDLDRTVSLPLPWNELKDTCILVSGGSGLIGSFLTDFIMYKNHTHGLNCQVKVMGRNKEKLRSRFEAYAGDPRLSLIAQDVNQPMNIEAIGTDIDYIFIWLATRIRCNTQQIRLAL